MLQLRLLGQFQVQVEGKPVVIPSRAAQSLLAFLILNSGIAHRREKLAGMLWPDMSDDGARRNLRHELWRLRKALSANQTVPAEYIISEELAIRFNPDAEYWLDVAQLERAPAPGDSLGDWIGRAALYRGELLPGFYDDWVGPERDRVQATFETRMDELLRRLIQEERWLTAIEWAERWIAVGHTPEAAYRALMLAHSAQGETSKIALDYERCAEALRADLDIEPSNETRALYEKLTHEELTSPAQLETSPAIFVQSSGTVTFLFSDIEGSTKLLDKLGPEYAKLLAEHQDLIRSIAERFHGHEVDTQGDSFFFAFFRAADAVAFATEAQRTLAVHKFPQDANVRVRMGLHTGEPMLARTGYVGMDVHRAARIGAAGHGGQVLLSPTTRALVENELPDGTTLRDLGEHKLKDLRYPVHIVQLTIEGLPADFPPLKSINTGSEPPAPGEPPFKGLDFFDEADANLFFGREQLIEKLANEVRANRFLAVVVGASGSGKSSVVRAGLIPALRESGDGGQGAEREWRVFVMTPTAHPLEALATVLTRDQSLTVTAQLLDDLAREPRSLHLWLRRITMDERTGDDPRPLSSAVRRFLLVVDQFEELFTLCRDYLEREQFVDNLVNAVAPNVGQAAPKDGMAGIAPTPSLTLVLTIRADFYAHLADYPELRNLVAKQQEYIGPMNTEELRSAIQEPAVRGHWEFEPGLADLILRDVGDEPGALPLLSHALLETWRRRSGHLMTLKGYHDAGGVRGAIAHTAESTYQLLSPEQQAIARNIFVRLTELGEGTEDTRRRAEIGELETGDWERARVRQVLTLLADARLITTGQDTVEVAHEALIREWPRLREWLNQDREGLKLHRALTEAANEWELMERDGSVLYRGARLAQAQEYATLYPNSLNAQERAFLEASRENEKHEAREREEQRERELLAAQKLAAEQQARIEETNRANKRLRQRAVFLAGVVILALVAAGAALFFLTQSNANLQIANEQHAEADLQRDNALRAEALAEKEKRAATARELASASVANLDIDPERSILLALQAVDATKKDGIVLREAEEALHRAVQTSRVVHTITGITKPNQVAFSADGKLLAVRGKSVIKIFDAQAANERVAIPTTPGYSDHIAFSPDGKQLVTFDAPEEENIILKILDTQTGATLRAMTLPVSRKDWAYSAYSPDWKRVAVGLADGTSKVFDMETGKELMTLKGHTAFVDDVAYSPDGTRIATASDDETAKIWDATTGKELLTLHGHSGWVWSINFSPDGKRIATSSADNTAKVWDAATGKELLKIREAGMVTNVSFSPDGRRIATSSGPGKARVFDISSGNEIATFVGHQLGVWGISFSPDGGHLATASDDGAVKIWDTAPSREYMTLPVEGISNFAIGAGTVAYSPDGTHLAVGLRDGTIKVWDATSGNEVKILRGHTDAIHKIAYNHDGTRLASASNDKTAKIWDMATGKELATLGENSGGIISVDWSPDGTRVATGSADHTVKIWNAGSGRVLSTFPVEQGVIFSVAFSPDGARLAAGNSGGQTVFVWDLGTDKLLYSQDVGFPVFHVAFSPDGSRLALPGVVLDAATGKPVLNLQGLEPGQNWVSFNADGTRLAVPMYNGTTKLFDAKSGQELLTLFAGDIAVRSAAFSPDSNRLAVVDYEAVRVYLLQVKDLVALAKTRLTRSLTQEECQKYLHVERCPKE